MKTEKTLKASSYFLKFLMIIQIILCLGLVFVYFHSMVSPEKYTSLIINEKRELVFNLNIKEVPKTYEEWKQTKQFIHYDLLNDYSKLYVIGSRLVKIIGFFFILYFFDKFLRSAKNLQIFFESNIKYLNKIIVLILGLFLIDLFFKGFTLNPISMIFNNGDIPHFVTKKSGSLDFIIYYPLTIIFFFLLREVFKRGQQLKQENDLTI